MKVDESIKTIFYLTHYPSLITQVNLKTEHTHFSKLCMLKPAVLYIKLNFPVFESSNIRNENQQVNKIHFLSCTTYLSINLSKIKTGHAHCSKLLKVIILVKKQHLGTLSN